MKRYDRSRPLIFIHVPKSAGTSTRRIFRKWFDANFYPHYINENKGTSPDRLNPATLHSEDSPLLMYGHFNRRRGFGIDDHYPEIDQFVTILRDPFETMVSYYYFMRCASVNWKDKSRVPQEDLESFLMNCQPFMLDHFPRQLTLDNYEAILNELFVEIGVVNKLEESLDRIGSRLGFEFQSADLKHLNRGERQKEEPPEYLRNRFIEKNPLEYRVYDYALSRYT